MMNREPVNEFDLLAYADGLLDEDPARKAQVEGQLRTSPEDAARVRAYRAQAEALRRQYGGRLAEPVPESLYAVLDHRPERPVRSMMRMAALMALTVAAGMAGWLIGQGEQATGWPVQKLLEQSYLNYVDTASDLAARPKLARAGSTEPLGWLAQEISLTLRTPDLSHLGYSPVDKQTVGTAGEQMVRLVYAAQDGRTFSLFLRPRWEDRNPGLQLTQEGDISLAYWFDGPLASAIASRFPPEQTLDIAKAVRHAMHDPQVPPPAVHSTPTLPLQQGIGTISTERPVSSR